jgi:two-component system, NarL family, response regulator NreC
VPGVIRVLVADDHTVVRKGLVELLQKEQGLTVVGEAADGLEALDLTHRLRPQVVLMDVTMPKMDGIEAAHRILVELPEVRVIGLSMHSDADMAGRMQAAGAVRYLMKDGPMEELVAAIRAVVEKPTTGE